MGTSFVKAAGLLCLVGAVIGVIGGLVAAFIPPVVSPEWYRYPYAPAGYVAAQLVYLLNHVLLLVGMLGLARSGLAGSGVLGRIGLWLSIVGMAALSVCEIAALAFVDSLYPGPGTATMDAAFGIASIMIGIGMTMAGIAVVRAGRSQGWRRYVILACGAAVFVIVVPGLMGSFLMARLAIVLWMMVFGAFGWALYMPVSEAESRSAPHGARSIV